jgi:hypothetical protein
MKKIGSFKDYSQTLFFVHQRQNIELKYFCELVGELSFPLST